MYEHLVDGIAPVQSLLLLKFESEHLDLLLRYLADRLEPSVSNEILESLTRIEAKVYSMNSGDGQNQDKED